VPAGSHRGILLLTLIDPLLGAGMFLAIAWVFGSEMMLLCMIYFCVLFGASFGYTGGAYLRHMWLFGVVVGVCCLHRQRAIAAGALFAWATLLRVFPGAFLVGGVCQAAAQVITARHVSRHHAKLLVAFAGTAVLLFASTTVPPRGLETWREFGANIARHLGSDAYNSVGLIEILNYTGPTKPATPEEFTHALARRRTLHLLQLTTIFALTAVFVARRSRREDDAGATALGVPLLFTALNLASYYYTLMLVLIVARRRDPQCIAVLFAAEAMMYTLTLFEDREVVLYFYHNVLLAFALVVSYVPRWKREGSEFGNEPLRRSLVEV